MALQPIEKCKHDGLLLAGGRFQRLEDSHVIFKFFKRSNLVLKHTHTCIIHVCMCFSMFSVCMCISLYDNEW